MHSELKQFGEKIKESKKNNANGVKEIAKVYNESKKKADKVRQLYDIETDQLDEKALIALEREATDLKMYKFYLTSCSEKIMDKHVGGVYRTIHKVLKAKPVLTVVDDKEVVVKKKTKAKKHESQKDLPKSKSKARRVEPESSEEEKENFVPNANALMKKFL